MTADSMTTDSLGTDNLGTDIDSTRSGVYQSELAAVREVAVEIARAAEEIRAVSARLTTTLTQSGLMSSAMRSPRTGLPAERALLRAAINREGLGYALTGGRLGSSAEKLGGLTGRENLSVLVAVTSLRLRVAAVTSAHPEIAEDESISKVVEAINADSTVATVRALRRLVKDKGLARALNGIAPVFTELLALNALLDEDPFNDASGWSIAVGKPVTGEPLLGVNANTLCRWDVGDGSAEPVELTRDEADDIRVDGTITGFVRNIATLKTTGRVFLQEVDGSRYILFVPGMQSGMPRNDSPQDMVGAWRNTLMNESPYTRALHRAIKAFGVPEGAEIALIGHSEGGAAAMNLAQETAFNTRYKVTHVIAIGAPVDFKKPPKEAFVATVTNQHDMIPGLDGQGPGSPFHLHPDWYVVDYNDDTHEFPACHSAFKYLHNLEYDLREAREHIDAALVPYQGKVTRQQAYLVFDTVRSPQGFPFLTVATAPVETSAGPVELPVRCSDSTAVTALFTAGAEAARELLAGTGLRPALLGRRAVVAVLPRSFRQTTVGAYDEVAVAVLVHDPWRPRPVLVWTDLLKRADRRRSGVCLLDLAMSVPTAVTLADDIWGYPSFLAEVEVGVAEGRLAAAVRDGKGTVMELSGSLGPWVPGPELDLVTYSRRAEQTLRSLVDTRGGQHAHPAPRLRLRAESDHPMARRLRGLGLNGARPFLVLSTERYQARLGAGVIMSLPDH